MQSTPLARGPSDAVGVLALACALALGGCASPYVVMERSEPLPELQPRSLADAIGLARSTHLTYRDKVVELGEAERLLSNSLLSLGTLIVGAAVAKVHSSAIVGGALLAGGAYTIGNANTDKRRAQIYIAGMKALDCAVDAVVPLGMSSASEAQLGEQRQRVQGATMALAKALGEAEGWAVQAEAIGETELFEAALTTFAKAKSDGEAALAKSATALALADQRSERPSQLAGALRTAVHSIDTAVLNEIRGTEGSLQAVPSILAQLQGNALLFTPTPVAAAASAATGAIAPVPNTAKQRMPQGATDAQAADFRQQQSNREHEVVVGLATSIGMLRQAIVVLAAGAERLNQLATPNNNQVAADSLKTCKVDGVAKAITATPVTVSIAAKTALTTSVLVDGGNGNYTAAFLQSPIAGLSTLIRPRSTGVVDIVATDQTVAGGPYQLLIEDTTRQTRQIVTVNVVAGTPADDNKGDKKADTKPNQAKAIALITAAGEVTVDGKTVKLRTVEKQGSNGVTVTYTTEDDSKVDDAKVATAVLNIPEVSNLIGTRAGIVTASPVIVPNAGKQPHSGGVAAFGPAVASLTKPNVMTVQRALCVQNVDGLWGPITQGALAADRERRRKAGEMPPANDALLTAPEAAALLKLSTDEVAKRCKG